VVQESYGMKILLNADFLKNVKKTSTKTVMITVSVIQNTSGTIIKENYIVNKPNQKTNALLQLGIQSKEDVNVKEIVKSMTSIIIVSITV
jgi:hypothetical protein